MTMPPLTPLPDFQPICLAPNRGNPTSPSRGEVLPLSFGIAAAVLSLVWGEVLLLASRAAAAVPALLWRETLPLAPGPVVFVPSPLGGEGQGEG